jgi:uncharacterized protein (TIGR04222 family)
VSQEQIMNIADIGEAEFVCLYMAAFVGTALGGEWVSRLISSEGEKPAQVTEPLDQYDLAVLAGGKENAFFAAVAALAHRDAVSLAVPQFELRKVKAVADLHPLEEKILSRLSDKPTKIRDVYYSVIPAFKAIEDKLVANGLVVPRARMNVARAVPAFMMIALTLFFALPKLCTELASRESIVCVSIFVVVSLIVAIRFALQYSRPTRAGQAILDEARQKNATLASDYGSSPKSMSGRDLALAAGLFGSDAMYWDPVAQVRLAYHGGVCGQSDLR